MLNKEIKTHGKSHRISFRSFHYEVYEISFAGERIGAEKPADRIHGGCRNINWSTLISESGHRLCRECFVNYYNMGTEAGEARNRYRNVAEGEAGGGEGGVSHGKSITSWSMIKRRFH